MRMMPTLSTTTDKTRQGNWLWAVLMSLLALFWVAGAINSYTEYQHTLEHEYQLLEVQARHREAHISGAVETVNLMLGSIINNLREKPQASVDEKNRLMKEVLHQLPQLRSLSVTDASGRIVTSSNEQVIGFVASDREYFKAHQSKPLVPDLHVSLPFKTVTGVFATTLSRVMLDKQHQFSGVAVATLESRFITAALDFQREAPDYQALLINLNGDILNAAPKTALIGKSLVGGAAFTEHVASGQASTRHLKVSKNESVKRLSVFLNLPKSPLTVVVYRDYDAAMAEWHTNFVVRVVGFIGLSGITVLLAIYASRRQRELVEREQFIRTITDAMPGMVAYWDQDMRCQFANIAYQEWFGKSPQALIGKTMRELMGEDLFAMNEPHIRASLKGEVQHFERTLTKADSSIGYTLAHYIPDIRAGGEVAGIFVLVIDVTPLKQAELALGERNASLLKEIDTRKKVEQALRDSEKRLQEMSIRDPLTGLYNRRYLDELLPRELARAKREGAPVAVIMLDLDHFKRVNDTYGHPAGDEVLMKLADILRNGARESDVICRYGGEEFIAVMPGMSTSQALQRVEAWRTDFAGEPLMYLGAAISVTLSAGIAAFPEHGSDMDVVLSRADKTLYWAKNHGRNQVAVYDADYMQGGDE
jgi:diguanylate cyclase (GGDEF)-like protein/PAS domain S-box-containing protein